MLCSKCGWKNVEGTRFCFRCGAQLRVWPGAAPAGSAGAGPPPLPKRAPAVRSPPGRPGIGAQPPWLGPADDVDPMGAQFRPRRRRSKAKLAAIIIAAWLAAEAGYIVLKGLREFGRQAECRANLRNLGTAMAIYEHDNFFRTPTLFVAETGGYSRYAEAPRAHRRLREFWDGDTAGGPGSTANNWWLLVHSKVAQESHFRCPSDADYTARRDTDAPYGFPRLAAVSYGLQPCMKAEAGPAAMVAYLGAPGQTGDTCVAGDRPTVELRSGAANRLEDWNENHHGVGCGLLKRGMTVAWSQRRDNNVGAYGNNVYRADLGEEGRAPEGGKCKGVTDHPRDSYLFWKQPYETADAGG